MNCTIFYIRTQFLYNLVRILSPACKHIFRILSILSEKIML